MTEEQAVQQVMDVIEKAARRVSADQAERKTRGVTFSGESLADAVSNASLFLSTALHGASVILYAAPRARVGAKRAAILVDLEIE